MDSRVQKSIFGLFCQCLYPYQNKGPHGARVQNHSTVTHGYLNNLKKAILLGYSVTRRIGHTYTQVGSKGKLCPVKLAFLFHMSDFRSPTEICSRQWQLWGLKNLLSSKVRTRTIAILWYDDLGGNLFLTMCWNLAASRMNGNRKLVLGTWGLKFVYFNFDRYFPLQVGI